MPNMNLKTLKQQSYFKFSNLYSHNLHSSLSIRLTMSFVEEWLPCCINENVDSFQERRVHFQVKCQHAVKLRI